MASLPPWAIIKQTYKVVSDEIESKGGRGRVSRELDTVIQPLCNDNDLHGLCKVPSSGQNQLQDGYHLLSKLQDHLKKWCGRDPASRTILDAYSPDVAFEFHQLFAGALHRFFEYTMELRRFQKGSKRNDPPQLGMPLDELVSKFFRTGTLLWRLSRSGMLYYHCKVLGYHNYFGTEWSKFEPDMGSEGAQVDVDRGDQEEQEEQEEGIEALGTGKLGEYIVKLLRVLVGPFDGLDVLVKLFKKASADSADFKFNILSVQKPEGFYTKMMPYQEVIQDIFTRHPDAGVEFTVAADQLRAKARQYLQVATTKSRLVTSFVQMADNGAAWTCSPNLHCEAVLASLTTDVLFPETELPADSTSFSVEDLAHKAMASVSPYFLLATFYTQALQPPGLSQ